MRDRPSGEALAALARESLAQQDEVSQSGAELARARRCFAIADRERRFGAAAFSRCEAMLAALYGEGDPEALFARLGADIRGGIYDAPGPVREMVRRFLWELTLQKLRESNPDFLAAHGFE